jgi:hypothetical protein
MMHHLTRRAARTGQSILGSLALHPDRLNVHIARGDDPEVCLQHRSWPAPWSFALLTRILAGNNIRSLLPMDRSDLTRGSPPGMKTCHVRCSFGVRHCMVTLLSTTGRFGYLPPRNRKDLVFMVIPDVPCHHTGILDDAHLPCSSWANV